MLRTLKDLGQMVRETCLHWVFHGLTSQIAVASLSASVGDINETHTRPSSELDDIQMVGAGNMVISIQVLQNVTNHFSEEILLGQVGFGIVYRDELQDGTKITVNGMESKMVTGKRLA